MQLCDLKIIVDGKVQRLIKFQDGLNLVINKRNTDRTGNSVGKSTLSRVIDFLFLASIKPIYIDEEFGTPNPEIEYFFRRNYVVASLTFIGLDSLSHEITRNFSIEKDDCEYFVDGSSVESSEYEKDLQKLCFNIETRRPSVRSLMPKFIRNDSHRMLNTYKFLDKRGASNKDYSELFLYLFGFDNTELLTAKRDANNLLTRRTRNLTSLNAIVKEQKPKSEIQKISVEAEELEKNLLKFDYAPEYEDPVAFLSELQIIENNYTDLLLDINRKILNIKKTVKLLSQKRGNYLYSELKAIYDYVDVSIEKPIQELKDVMSFHDNLISRKKEFLELDLPHLNNEKNELESEIRDIRRDKSKVFSDMRSTESIDNITENLKKLGYLKVNLGRFQGLLEQQTIAKSEQSNAQDKLTDILSEITEEITKVEWFKSFFNEEFKKLTKAIHDEAYEFELEFNEQKGTCEIQVTNGASNP